MVNKVNEIIISELNELIGETNVYIDTNTKIFGEDGLLDSIDLVSLIVAVEQKIEDKFDINITLADERAMSQKNSPFKSIDSLSKYVLLLLGEAQNE